MNYDPDRIQAAIAAIPGAALYGLFHIAVLLKTGQPVTSKDVAGVLINLLCAVACGVILAYTLAGMMQHIPWPSLRDPWLVGIGVGAFGWELLPYIYTKIRGRAQQQIDQLETKKEDGQ